MRPRPVVALVLVATIGGFAAVAPLASAQTSTKKVPPVCVQKTVAKVAHVQVGYCP
jgi:hypothetical protein